MNIHVGQNCLQTNKIICIRFDVVFTVTIHSIFHSFPARTFSRAGLGWVLVWISKLIQENVCSYFGGND